MHHRRDFLLKDADIAYLLPAKLFTCNAIDLLWGEGEELKKVKESYNPVFDKNTYMEYWNALSK